ncbi:5' nucleotidase, NT5C type [Bacillus sp. 1P06AnD]|uniref:5' nucleotidase, NT5C type n=1 Tax=Bacillus sp. 1P06AnD TaxID=3132208 RepID=UPI0039A0EB2B
MQDQLFILKVNQLLGTDFKATIMLDMDDVLAELGTAWIKKYNERYEDTLTTQHMTEWDTSQIVKPECGPKVYDLLKEPGMFRYLQPTPHSQEVVQRLVEERYNILIVSDSPRGHAHSDYKQNPSFFANPADDKRAWLAEYFPMIPQENIFFGSQKYYVRGDVLVDDKPETHERFTSLGLNVILLDQPYNQHIQAKWRAKNMLEVEEMIGKVCAAR